MRSLLTNLVMILLPFICFGQTHFEEHALTIVSQNELKGNVILLNSEKIREAKNSGMLFQSFSVQLLDSEFSDETKLLEIKRIELIDHLYLIQFNAASFCGYSFLGEIQILGNTLNLIYQGYGSSSIGNCRYTFQYEVKKEENEAVLNLKYIMINGNPKTKIELDKKFVN